MKGRGIVSSRVVKCQRGALYGKKDLWRDLEAMRNWRGKVRSRKEHTV